MKNGNNVHTSVEQSCSLSRRDLLRGSALAALVGLAGGSACSPESPDANLPPHPTYASLGVRPVINCWGTITVMGGSLVLPYVKKAIDDASRQFVFLDELMEKVSQRIADLTGTESGIITSGAAGALVLATAACVAGQDPKKMNLLPDCSELKNEVLVHKLHHHGYERCIRSVGVKLIECESLEDMYKNIHDRTAMISTMGDSFDKPDSPKEEEFVALARKTGVPLLVDAAAERPDAPNRYTQVGVDLVAYSGGKCMRGPQSTGLLLGRKDLTWAAYMNSSPHLSIGRGMKVDKEEIVGGLAALEWWLTRRDHEGEWKTWEGYLKVLSDAMALINGVRTEVLQPGRINVTPTLAVTWDPGTLGITPRTAHDLLLDGEPRIQMATREDGLLVNPYMLEPGEAEIVAKRMGEVLGKQLA